MQTYIKPLITVINCTSILMDFTSGWGVDGKYEGDVKEDKEPEWGEND